jgi:hypothetical protein
MVGLASAAVTVDRYADLFDDDPDAEADRPDVVRGSARGYPSSFSRTAAELINLPRSLKWLQGRLIRDLQLVETRGLEP